MDGRVCLVTGGNAGIGEATAAGLARLGADVTIVSRDAAKGKAAADRIKADTGRRVRVLPGDLGSLAGVRALAERVRDALPRLHVLVNNAGLLATERRETPDGFELTFGVNHLAPFLLTNLLLDRLVESGTARVVNVSSALYARGALDFEDLQMEKGFDGFKAYARSKMCNVLFTRELARRLEGRGATANSLHPGVVRTGLADDAKGLVGRGMRLVQPLLTSPAKGARTSIHLAASHDVATVSGAYFVNCRARKVTRYARKPEHARLLWTVSERLTGLI
jgi:NAD(P)-dependent dehydrogenase (short-subunit alcohol dehydrogenase family)